LDLEELSCSLSRLLHNCAVCSSKASFIACIYTLVNIIQRKLISGYLMYSFFIEFIYCSENLTAHWLQITYLKQLLHLNAGFNYLTDFKVSIKA